MRRPLGFVHDTTYADLPDEVRWQARRCLLDVAGVAAAGTSTPLSRIVRGHAHRHAPGIATAPRLLFDGRHAGLPSAAWANAATVDSMDGHDGHRLTKGHAGAAIVPAVLAFVDGPDERGTHDLLTAVTIGYELALRAGIALHDTAADYHSSGAWNALGAAAVGARLLGLGDDATEHALGIAEYSAPRAPMMRAIDHPTMVKDSSAWGAHAGVSAALLAADGFTGAPAALVSAGGTAVFDDLGERWYILEQYFKPYPVCRWAHPAIQAALGLREEHRIDSGDIDEVEVHTFAAATRLATAAPRTTEQAQYSLPYPVAAALVHGELNPEHVLDPGADDAVRRLAARIRSVEDEAMTAAFPARRQAQVTLVLRDGRRLPSDVAAADGDPETPLSDGRLRDKFSRYTAELDHDRAARLADAILTSSDIGTRELLNLLTGPV